jgi:hypothetical protein
MKMSYGVYSLNDHIQPGKGSNEPTWMDEFRDSMQFHPIQQSVPLVIISWVESGHSGRLCGDIEH